MRIGVTEITSYNLRNELDKEITTKAKYFLDVAKPSYKNVDKWKHLFTSNYYNDLDAVLAIQKIK